jgi:hypothetical protein
MEDDSIRTSGNQTLVEIWIDGKLRAISVSHEAIGAFLGFERAAGMSDADYCEFVRTHLPVIVAAAKVRLREDPTAQAVNLSAGHIPKPDGGGGDRRTGERRTEERRKAGGVKRESAQPDRRRADRRTGERRRSPRK